VANRDIWSVWNLIVGAAFEEVSMPFVFRTARALSVLGSPASVRAFVAAVAAFFIAAQTVAAADATSSENSI
jgi:hypothetical protein